MRKILSSNGIIVYVDDDVYEWINGFSWFVGSRKNKQYAHTRINSKTVYMHRMIYELKYNISLKRTQEIDHIDGNGINNQLSNLRIANRSENMANMEHHIKSTSQYKGVYNRGKYKHPWQSKLMKDGKNVYLGYFDTEIEAAIQYDLGAIYYFGKYAKLNFPDRRQEYLEKLNSGFNPVHIPRKTTSKYRGVSFDSYSGKWRARLKVDGKDISLGLFATEQEAYEATLVSI